MSEKLINQINAANPPEEYDLLWGELLAIRDREPSPMAACYDAFKLGFLRGQQVERKATE